MWSELSTKSDVEDCKGEMAGVVVIAERMGLTGVRQKETVSHASTEVLGSLVLTALVPSFDDVVEDKQPS